MQKPVEVIDLRVVNNSGVAGRKVPPYRTFAGKMAGPDALVALAQAVRNLPYIQRKLDKNLIYSVTAGDESAVKKCLSEGANPNALDLNGFWTPLFHAREKGHRGIMKILISHGADVDARDGTGRTVLHHCASHNDAEGARILLDAGADIDALSDNKTTPLISACANGHMEMVRFLVSENAKTVIPGVPPASYYARINGYPWIVDFLKEHMQD